jgi:hypothetical protein
MSASGFRETGGADGVCSEGQFHPVPHEANGPSL